jgi:hypothetical protein
MWSKWCKWFGSDRPSRPSRRGPARGPKAHRPRPSSPPQLEPLEDRTVPSILFGDTPNLTTSDNNGPVLANAQVRLVFWGSGWLTYGTLEAQMQSAVDALNSSTYFYSPLPGADLSQYRPGSAARPTRVGTFSVSPFSGPPYTYSDPGSTVAPNDVANMLKSVFGMTTNYYYFVVPQPGSVLSGISADHTFWSQASSKEYFGFTRDLGSLNDLTYQYSHEMAESITDPDGTALQVNPRNSNNWNEICDGQAQNYSYRVNGVLAQSYWSQADGKFTVPTGQSQNFYVSSSRVLTVNGDQLGINYNDTITLDVSGGGVRVTLNGETAQFDPGAISSVVVNTGGGTDTVNVLRTLAGVPVTIHYNGGGGSDVANLGVGGSVQGLQGAVTIYNGPSYTHVNIDDSADGGNRTVTIGPGGVTGLAPAAINFGAVSLNTLTVSGGSGNNSYTITGSQAYQGTTLNTGAGADTVNVQATPYALSINYQGGGGSDVANLGNAGSVQGITGAVTIYNGPSYTHVNIDDSADGGNRTVTIGPGGVTGLAPAAINFTSFSVNSLSVLGGGGNSTYTIAATPVTTSLSLNTGGGVDHVFVQATSAPTSVITNSGNGGGGSDIVTLGGLSAQGLQGAVTIYNGPSYTHVIIEDVNDGGNRAVTIGAGGVTGLAPAAINFTSFSVNSLSVLGGSGNNTYTIAASPATTTMSLDTGGGVDAVNVQATSVPLAVNTTSGNGGGGNDVVNVGNAGSLAGIQAAVTVLNTPSHDQLTVNDSADAGNHPAVTVSASGITGLAPAALNFTPSSVSTLTVNGGSGNNAYTVTGAPASQGTTLNTGSGTDTVNVRGSASPLTVNSAAGSGADVITLGDASNTLSGITGAVTLNAAPTDSLVLNDQGFAGARTYTVIPTALTWSGGPLVSYGGLQSLTINGSAGGDTFDLSAGTSSTAAVVLNGGGGSNTLKGANSGNFWEVAGADAGTLSGAAYPHAVSFHQVGNLIAGSGGDTFRFDAGATLSGHLIGGGSDTLDYSPYSSSVVVDLQTGFATGVAGGVSGIRNVIGGSGGAAGTYNLLIGAGGDTLTGGTGRRNILVAGGSASTLTGGTQDDLLIGGFTQYDTDPSLAAWQQIAAYWAGTDDFPTRVSNLTSGNGVPLLDATTVTGNGGGNTMNGTGELALIYTDGLDTIGTFDPASQMVTIAP